MPVSRVASGHAFLRLFSLLELVLVLRTYVSTTVSSRAESLLPAVGVAIFFLAFGGQGVRNLFGWVGFGVIAGIVLIAAWVIFFLAGRAVTLRRLSLSVSSYILVCCLSVIWSQYRLETFGSALITLATSSAGVLVAIAFPLRQMLDVFTQAMKIIVAASYALELWVSLVVGHRIPPMYMRNWKEVPELYYWVNDALFKGGPIQGFVGNRNPLAFIALLLMLCVLVLWAEDRTHHLRNGAWLLACVGILVLTGSATVFVAMLVSVSALVFFLIIRRLGFYERRFAVRVALTAAASFLLVAVIMKDQVTILLGRSSDMTGRGVIWQKLLELWQQHPFLGWGWVVLWPPWLPLFKNLVVRPDGTPTMQAHNAYIEALFQTGIVGLMLLAFAVLWVMIRIFRVALRDLETDLVPTLAAVLMLAMFVQSFTESRLLTEGNWVLFVAFATWLKVRAESYDFHPPRRAVPGGRTSTTAAS